MMKPILWLTQMLPIYRQLDGDGAVGKNAEVFKATSNVLKGGRNLLIFGEGFTDDVFIRRLKPIKKGPARIGFIALESMNWKKKVYVSTIGINYGQPNYFRSDVVIANSERFCLNEYHEIYKENPNKAITEVTRRIEAMMKPLITHIENKDWAEFHEQVIQIRRDGLHPENTDLSIPLKQRYENSKRLANWINQQDLENEELIALKKQADPYFRLQKRLGLSEKYVYEKASTGKLATGKELLYLIIALPIALLGAIHLILPYLLVKKFTEKTFKRHVFWSSVKMMVGMLVMALFTWPIVALLNSYFIHNGWLSLLYFFTLPLFGIVAYTWKRKFVDFQTKRKLNKMDLKDFVQKRNDLEEKIKLIIFDVSNVNHK